MTKWKKLLALLLALVMVLSLAACDGATSGETDADADNAAAEESGSDTGTDAEGETADTSVLHVALTNSFTGGSAINTADPYRYSTLNQVYETLLCYADGEYYGDLGRAGNRLSRASGPFSSMRALPTRRAIRLRRTMWLGPLMLRRMPALQRRHTTIKARWKSSMTPI